MFKIIFGLSYLRQYETGKAQFFIANNSLFMSAYLRNFNPLIDIFSKTLCDDKKRLGSFGYLRDGLPLEYSRI